MDCTCCKMEKKVIMLIYVLYIYIPMAKVRYIISFAQDEVRVEHWSTQEGLAVQGAVPGTFFWKPRLGLDLSIPTTEFSMAVNMPTKENLQEGLVVLMDGYSAGMTVISLAAGASSAENYPHFNPMSAFFYTNVYRWALRYISLIPFWMGGHGGNYCETHKVWKRRYYYMDEFVPSWLRTALFFVKKEDWEKEELEYKRFKKYAESAFGKHYRNTNKVFNDFKSQFTVETVDNDDVSSSSHSI